MRYCSSAWAERSRVNRINSASTWAFFNDERIAGRYCFDLGIGQRSGVHVFETANRHVPLITWEMNFAFVSNVCHI